MSDLARVNRLCLVTSINADVHLVRGRLDEA